MLQLRFHGRGGQGTVKGCQTLAKALVADGRYAQFIPAFGVERKGSPVYGYFRMDDREIRYNCQVYHPDVVVVSDRSLLSVVDVFEGTSPGARVIVNAACSPEDIEAKDGASVYTVDATGIALSTIGLDIPNTAMLGAVARLIDGVNPSLLREYVLKGFGEKNALAFDEGYRSLTGLNEGE